MPYKCPTCGSSDPDLYIRCHDPMCPDGRDQRRLDPPEWRLPKPSLPPRPPRDMRIWPAVLVTAIIATLLTLLMVAVGFIRPTLGG